MKRLLLVLLAGAMVAPAQRSDWFGTIRDDGAPTGLCENGSLYVRNDLLEVYCCGPSGTWTMTYPVAGVSGPSGPTGPSGPSGPAAVIPTGAIILTLGAACPAGFTMSTAFQGRMALGVASGATDVGATGGADSITPAGTIAWPGGVPTFTGGAVTSSSASVGASGRGATSATLTPMTHTHSVTASGTVAWPASGPTLTGTSFDNRSAYVKVLFCQAN